MGNCFYKTETFSSSNKLPHEKNKGLIPYFTVLDVCDIILNVNRLEARIGVLIGRLDFIHYALRHLKNHKPNQVSQLTKTKDYLMHHVKRSRDKVKKQQLELKAVLEGKQTIELAIAKLNVKDVRYTEWLLWEPTNSNSNTKENEHNEMMVSLLETLPNLRDLAAKYEMQNSILISLMDIAVSIGDKSEELFEDIEMLEEQLIEEGSIHECPSDFYSEPREIVIEDFDYYSYSSVAPIVPPLHFNWIKDEPENDVVKHVQVSNSTFRILRSRMLTNFCQIFICSCSNNKKNSTGLNSNDFTSMSAGSTNSVHKPTGCYVTSQGSRIGLSASVESCVGSLQSVKSNIKIPKSIKQRIVDIFRRRK